MATERERLSTLETREDENSKTLWRIHEAIYGNGKPGLIADVHAIKQMVHALGWLIGLAVAVMGVIAAFIG